MYHLSKTVHEYMKETSIENIPSKTIVLDSLNNHISCIEKESTQTHLLIYFAVFSLNDFGATRNVSVYFHA